MNNQLEYIGTDYWQRKLFRMSEVLVDVDGQLHTVTPEGEPIAPAGIPTPTEIIYECDYEKLREQNKELLEALEALLKDVEHDGTVWTPGVRSRQMAKAAIAEVKERE